MHVSSVLPLILRKQIFSERVNVDEQSTKATAADGHMIFRRAAEADRVTVTSIAIATGEYPAAVMTTELTRMPKPWFQNILRPGCQTGLD